MNPNKYKIVVHILFWILFAFPLLPNGMKSISIILFTVVGIILYFLLNKTKKDNLPKKIYLFWFIIPYLFLGVSLIYTENLKTGFDLLIRMLPLFLLPIVLFLNQGIIGKRELNIGKYIFSGSVIILLGLMSFKTIHSFETLNAPPSKKELLDNGIKVGNPTEQKTTDIKFRRFKKFIETSFKTHSTYLGIYVVIALFILGEFIFKKQNSIAMTLGLLSLWLFLLIWLFLIPVRSPIISSCIAIFTTFLLIQRKRIWVASSLGLVSCLLISAYFLSPALKYRTDEVFKNKFNLPERGDDVTQYNSTNVRLGCYFCSWEIFKTNTIFGVGMGDVQDELNKCYNEKIGAVIYTWENYNNHNQYLYFLTAAGILCLILFVIQSLTFILYSIKIKDSFAIYFFIALGLVFLTENVLYRADGILVYALFSSALIFIETKNK